MPNVTILEWSTEHPSVRSFVHAEMRKRIRFSRILGRLISIQFRGSVTEVHTHTHTQKNLSCVFSPRPLPFHGCFRCSTAREKDVPFNERAFVPVYLRLPCLRQYPVLLSSLPMMETGTQPSREPGRSAVRFEGWL